MTQLPTRLTRRAALSAAVGIGAMLSPLARAQSDAGWPNRPIKIIVPFPAGVGVDVVVRTIAGRLGDRLGQAVVIDNKPGAGGNIGIEQAARSHGLPVLFGVLTCDTLAQAMVRAGGDAADDYAGNKGAEAAIAAIEMVSLQRELG